MYIAIRLAIKSMVSAFHICQQVCKSQLKKRCQDLPHRGTICGGLSADDYSRSGTSFQPYDLVTFLSDLTHHQSNPFPIYKQL